MFFVCVRYVLFYVLYLYILSSCLSDDFRIDSLSKDLLNSNFGNMIMANRKDMVVVFVFIKQLHVFSYMCNN